MTAQFSRTMRSLEADGRPMALAPFAVIVLLLGVWAYWFWGARLPVYETTRSISVDRNGTVVATVPAVPAGRIRTGQAATLRLDGATGADAEPLKAMVSDVDTLPGGAGERAELFIKSAAELKPGATGEVQIQVDQISPATIALRAISQQLSNSQADKAKPAQASPRQ